MKNLLFSFILFSFTITYCQNQGEKISIQYEQITKLEVIEKIESKINYRFFFVESWLDNDLVTGSYDQVRL